MADPTMASLDRFRDPSLWRVIRDVPVFDEHDEFDEEGKLVRRFARSDLEAIAARCNARERLTGDCSPIGPGHTLRQAKESDQPVPFGYGRNWKVGTFGPSGKTALLVDFYLKPEHASEAMTYPRRSVELWMKDGIIDWIALLRRTPQRDLGLLSDFVDETDLLPRYLKPGGEVRGYERKGDRLLVYSMEGHMPESEHHDPDLAGGRTTVFDHSGSTDVDEGDGAEKEQMHKFAAHAMQMFMAHPLIQHLHKKYAAEITAMGGPAGAPAGGHPTLPSSTNTALASVKPPEHKTEEVMHNGKDPTDLSRQERSGEALQYAKLERENKELAARFVKLEGRLNETLDRYQTKEREGELLKLQADGYQLDVTEELADCQAMDKAQFEKHLQRIVRKYQKDPTGPWIPVTERTAEDASPREGAVGEMSQRQLDVALQYQREKDCEWGEAYEYAMKKK